MQGRPDPFEQMESMIDQMRRSAFGTWADQARPAIAGRSAGEVGATVEEREDGYVVLADLPGFERDELDITYDDGVLTIAGTHEVSDDAEYRHRSVHETVRVPGEVVLDDVTATYRNGVLEILLPVEEESSDEYRIDVE